MLQVSCMVYSIGIYLMFCFEERVVLVCLRQCSWVCINSIFTCHPIPWCQFVLGGLLSDWD